MCCSTAASWRPFGCHGHRASLGSWLAMSSRAFAHSFCRSISLSVFGKVCPKLSMVVSFLNSCARLRSVVRTSAAHFAGMFTDSVFIVPSILKLRPAPPAHSVDFNQQEFPKGQSRNRVDVAFFANCPVNIYGPDGVTLSDHLKWIGQTPTGVWSVTACPGPPVTPRATEMIFYSLDEFGDQTR